MKADRQKLARDTISSGQADAAVDPLKAESDAERIRSFAERQASNLKAIGDQEAGRFIAMMQENPQLACCSKSFSSCVTPTRSRSLRSSRARLPHAAAGGPRQAA